MPIKNTARIIVGIVTMALVCTTVVACSHSGSTTGQGGHPTGGANGAPAPGGTPNMLAGGGPAPTSTVASPFALGHKFPADYVATAAGPCSWSTNAQGAVLISAAFLIQGTGVALASSIPSVLTDNVDSASRSIAVPVAQPVDIAIGNTAGATHYPGKTVRLTLTIRPPAGDTHSANNVVSIRVKVPHTAPPTAEQGPMSLPCS